MLFRSGRESTLRELDPATGEVVALVTLEQPLFGEGLTVIDGEIIQLTWRDGRALRWDVDTLEPVGEFGYAGEGWGICALGDELVMSDGTPEETQLAVSAMLDLDTWDPGDSSASPPPESSMYGTTQDEYKSWRDAYGERRDAAIAALEHHGIPCMQIGRAHV